MPCKERKKGKWTGKWRGAVMVDGQRRTGLFDTMAEAKTWEVEERKRLKSPGEQTPQGMELRIFFSKYLDFAEQRFVKKTYLEKRALAQKVCDKWGKHTLVDTITVDMVGSYLEQQAKERSNYSSNKDRKNLLAAWNWGVKRLDLQHNPVSKTSPLPHDRKPQYTPTEKDILKLLAAATMEDRVLLHAYINTAARRGEVFCWKWHDDINFEKREVRLGTRKTRDGSMEYEWVHMNPDLYDHLWWLWKNRKVKDSPYVFVCTIPGRYYGQPYVTRKRFMKSICKRAMVRPFGFHALRRYGPSLLVDKYGASMKAAQVFCRHKSMATTERYLGNIHSDRKEIANLLSHRVEENQNEKNLHEGFTRKEKGV
jgi:integrase